MRLWRFGGVSSSVAVYVRWFGAGVAVFFGFFLGSGVVMAASNFDAEMAASSERVANYERDLSRSLSDAEEIGGELGDIGSDLGSLNGRIAELDARLAALERELRAKKKERLRAENEYRRTLISAYRGGAVSELGFLLEDMFDAGDRIPVSDIGRVLMADAEGIEKLRESEDELREISTQVEEIRSQQALAAGEQANKRKELAKNLALMETTQDELRREIESEQEYVKGVREEKRSYQREKLEALRRAERARIDAQAAATAESSEKAERETEERVMQEIYTGETAEELPYDEYIKLYRESAERYGFGEDWYILAAIGKIESDHGQNLGPSSAGAMGPMQFLPSTWETSGVDGNGDGFANIMDAEDAIPAAAGYLVAGGAPEDWYAAIYSYNRADWYVQEVMTVAEGYRELDEQGGFD